MRSRISRRRRRGNIVVLSAFMMIVMFGVMGFAIDLGYFNVSRTQLQRTADASAIAAVWELIDNDALSGYANSSQTEANARTVAAEYAAYNAVLNRIANLAEEDVEIGFLANPSDPNAEMDTSGLMPPNAVRVAVRRTADLNGNVPLFFAPLLGIKSLSTMTEATAALINNFRGFRAPDNGDNLGMLPFALDIDTWNDLLAGNGPDDWTWDAQYNKIVEGSDGILEVNLYPQGTGSPGNRGTVDIGSSNNSTSDIARQITDGVTPEDLAFHGGSLQLDENGELQLNADTGISAGVKDELDSIKGQPRVIPVFAQVFGNGNNAQYVIVQFIGVRIMDVKLTGQMNSKRVIVQPANIVASGGIPSNDTEQTSFFVYSPAWLVR